jgi:UDP-N-acetylglucosamine 2-epimerase (non-hydrolysing)
LNKLKVITIVGTRPELIRLSRVISRLDESLNHILVHTGQNYDYELNELFFDELKINKPKYYLDVDTSSLGKVLGNTLISIEKVLIKEKPDAVLILGDTNSSLAAIMAKRLHIPIYHMEAGNRSFDLNVPEEINRRIVDHIADFNLVYTEHSRRHLLSEGLSHRHIYLTGSPMYEVLNFYSDMIDNSSILDKLKLKKKKYFTVSMHREENVDNKIILKNIISILNEVSSKFNLPIIFSCHPRTKKMINQLDKIKISKKIQFLKPFGFFDYIKLQKNSICVISDSGTISEESAILNFPAITPRNSMERPEALDSGSIILSGFDKENVMNSIDITINQYKTNKINKVIPKEYLIPDTSLRTLNLIVGTAKLSNIWAGINNKNKI